MKKIVFILTGLISIVSYGQETLLNKNGNKILPESGDWAIQMSAQPFLNTAINAVNIMNDSGEYPSADYVDGFNNTIVGKMFVNSKKARRVKATFTAASYVNSNFGDDPTTQLVLDNPETQMNEFNSNVELNYLFLKERYSFWSFGLGYGMEYRKGNGRLQGFYGYEGMVRVISGDENNPNITYDYQYDLNDIAATEENMGQYVTKDFVGKGISIEGSGFIGVEYFVASKISIGAELSLGFSYTKFGRGDYDYSELSLATDPNGDYLEDSDGNYIINLEEVKSETNDLVGRSFLVNVNNMNGALTATFYF